MNNSKTYFFKSFFAILLATASFLIFKSFLPKRIFEEGSSLTENVVIDSLLIEAVADAEKEVVKDTLANKQIDFKPVKGVKFPSETFKVYKGDQFLVSFFEKLFQLEQNPTKKVRIATLDIECECEDGFPELVFSCIPNFLIFWVPHPVRIFMGVRLASPDIFASSFINICSQSSVPFTWFMLTFGGWL